MAQRATSLGPKPSLFLFFLFLFLFCFQKKCFLPEEGHFCYVSLCSSLAFSLPLFTLSFSVSVLLFSFFLPCFLSFFLAFFCFLVFVSLFLCLGSLLLFHEKQHQNLELDAYFHQSFQFFGFPVLFYLSNTFFLSCFLPHLKLCFCSTSMFLSCTKDKLENTNLG